MSHTAYQAQRHRDCVALKVCRQCKEPAAPGRVRCNTCLSDDNARARARRAERMVRNARCALKVCVCCGGYHESRYEQCMKCLVRRRESRRLYSDYHCHCGRLRLYERKTCDDCAAAYGRLRGEGTKRICWTIDALRRLGSRTTLREIAAMTGTSVRRTLGHLQRLVRRGSVEREMDGATAVYTLRRGR